MPNSSYKLPELSTNPPAPPLGVVGVVVAAGAVASIISPAALVVSVDPSLNVCVVVPPAAGWLLVIAGLPPAMPCFKSSTSNVFVVGVVGAVVGIAASITSSTPPCAARSTSPAFCKLLAGALPVIAGLPAAMPCFKSSTSNALAPGVTGLMSAVGIGADVSVTSSGKMPPFFIACCIRSSVASIPADPT